MVYGGDEPIDVLRRRLPAVRVMSRSSLKSCALGYLAMGWSGYVPAACERTLILLPADIAPFAWGWPHRLIARMHDVGTEVFVAGNYDNSDGASGIDEAAQFRALPARYSGGIWTNRVDRIAPLVAEAHRSDGSGR